MAPRTVVFLLLTAIYTQARMSVPPALVDIQRDLLPGATVIFRGRVADVTPPPSGPGQYIATFEPDRWYRGTDSDRPTLAFAYNDGLFIQGHDCILFQPNTYWLVFAKVQANGTLQLVHDCHGALSVSSRLGRDSLQSGDIKDRLEADFEAGVDDSEPDARLASIQRLGNLKLSAARPTLHRVLEACTDTEKPWVVLAALRTGDVTALPAAAERLRSWTFRAQQPEGWIAIELRNLSDRDGVPSLIELLRTASDPFVKNCVIYALAETFRDPRAVPQIAAFLGSPDKYLNYDAVLGMWNITHASACSLEHWKEEDLPAIGRACKLWWESQGSTRSWDRP